MLATMAACLDGGTAAEATAACAPVRADDVLETQLMSIKVKQKCAGSLYAEQHDVRRRPGRSADGALHRCVGELEVGSSSRLTHRSGMARTSSSGRSSSLINLW
jgi:hypothetical protein